jgi:hypothetical protein
LLAAMGFPGVPVYAVRLFSFSDRRNGKLHLAQRSFGAPTAALVLTDSLNDLDLLRGCARPLRTRWPDAKYRRALSHVYLPGEYISRVKRPGERYILQGILQEDFAFWVLSSIALASTNYASHFAGLLLLLLSFWSIYEVGYVDNDGMASRYEMEPKLSREYATVEVATPAVQPWFWALGSGAAGIWILQLGMTSFVVWVGVLVVLQGVFFLYNRVDKMTRVWIYPYLQFGRSAAFVAVVPIGPIGLAALGAHALSRWLPYVVYRHAPGRWPDIKMGLIRLTAFALLAALTAAASGLGAVLTWTALALLGWNIVRARHDISSALKGMHTILRQSRRTTANGGPPVNLHRRKVRTGT